MTNVMVRGILPVGWKLRPGFRMVEGREPRAGRLAVDAGGLSFMDSSGLRSMLIARAAAEDAGVRFRITRASPVVRRLFERTGLTKRLLDE